MYAGVGIMMELCVCKGVGYDERTHVHLEWF